MRLVIRFLGLDLLDVDLSTGAEEPEDERPMDGGFTGSTAISFDRSGDSRWNPGVDYGAGEPEDRCST